MRPVFGQTYHVSISDLKRKGRWERVLPVLDRFNMESNGDSLTLTTRNRPGAAEAERVLKDLLKR